VFGTEVARGVDKADDVSRVYTFRWRWLFAGLAGINSRSSVLDPFRSAFRVVLGRSERGVYARSDE
jgi:hypothetical protein